jgi:DNA-binding XRE family transcriptional regulator
MTNKEATRRRVYNQNKFVLNLPPHEELWKQTINQREVKMTIKFGLGERLRNLRKIHGLSQSQMAKKLSMQPSSISHFENETRLPSCNNLFIICRRMGWSSDYLLGLQDLGDKWEAHEETKGKLDKILEILEESK